MADTPPVTSTLQQKKYNVTCNQGWSCRPGNQPPPSGAAHFTNPTFVFDLWKLIPTVLLFTQWPLIIRHLNVLHNNVNATVNCIVVWFCELRPAATPQLLLFLWLSFQEVRCHWWFPSQRLGISYYQLRKSVVRLELHLIEVWGGFSFSVRAHAL